ncbi:MAG: hypothetical protein ACXACH_01735 [Candidatus Hermodarchaeia archaeon]
MRRIGLLLVSLVLLTSIISGFNLIIPQTTADDISVENKQVSLDYYWMFLYGPGSASNAFNSIVACQDGGYIATGEVSVEGITSIPLVRISDDGRILWHQIFRMYNYQVGNDVIECESGGFAIIGEANEPDCAALLIRTDELGALSWYGTYRVQNFFETGQAIIECSSGGFAFTGYRRVDNYSNFDCWLVRTDSTGFQLWDMDYGGIYADFFYSLLESSDGGFVLAGGTRNNDGDQNAWILGTNSTGGSIWSAYYGDVGAQSCFDLIQGDAGNYVIVGETDFTRNLSPDGFIASFLVNGTLQWNTTFGTALDNHAYAVTQCDDGSYAVTGRTIEWGEHGALGNLWLVRFSSGGVHLWNKSYGGNLGDEGRAILQSSAGAFVIAGRGEGSAEWSYAWCFQVPDDAQTKWIYRIPGPPNFFFVGLGSGLACLVLFGTFLIFHRSKAEISTPVSKPSKRIIRKSYKSPHLFEEISRILKGKTKCSKCGERWSRAEIRCSHCNAYLHRCFFCAEPIQENDPILFCPSCEALAHQHHMEDWLVKRQYCPRCKFRFKKDSSTSRL